MTQLEIECKTGGQSMVILGTLVVGVHIFFLPVVIFFYAHFIKLTKKIGNQRSKLTFLVVYLIFIAFRNVLFFFSVIWRVSRSI